MVWFDEDLDVNFANEKTDVVWGDGPTNVVCYVEVDSSM